MTQSSGVKGHQQTLGEQLQFRLLLSLAFCWFFIGAVLCRLTFQSVAHATPGESCFQAAKKAAYGVVPYAFMRV
ncbi:MAG: hypothetical protein PVJ95_02200 [Cellvibrionales bacterium]|jgi:hypothetical protein